MGKCSICGKKFHPIKMEMPEVKNEPVPVEEEVVLEPIKKIKNENIRQSISKFFKVDDLITSVRNFDTQMRNKEEVQRCVEEKKKKLKIDLNGEIYYRMYGITYDNILYGEVIQKRMSMLEGKLWQNVLGTINFCDEHGVRYKCTDLGVGHESGCDLLFEKIYPNGNIEKIIIELKNRINTMNSSSGEKVVEKLIKQHESGMKACLMYIHTDGKKTLPRYKAPSYIDIVGGSKSICKYLGIHENCIDNIRKCIETSSFDIILK